MPNLTMQQLDEWQKAYDAAESGAMTWEQETKYNALARTALPTAIAEIRRLYGVLAKVGIYLLEEDADDESGARAALPPDWKGE